jgi:hypothetical protein
MPKERAGHTAVIKDKNIYVIGGGSLAKSYHRDMYILEIDTGPQYNIKKSSGRERIFKEIKAMLNMKKFSDFEIVIEDSTYFCHRFILSILSEKFEVMFSADFMESTSGKLEVKDHQ